MRKLSLMQSSIGIQFDPETPKMPSLEGTPFWNAGLVNHDIHSKLGLRTINDIQQSSMKLRKEFLQHKDSFTSIHRNQSRYMGDFISASDFFSIPNHLWSNISIGSQTYLRFSNLVHANILDTLSIAKFTTDIFSVQQFTSIIKDDPNFCINNGILLLGETQNGVKQVNAVKTLYIDFKWRIIQLPLNYDIHAVQSMIRKCAPGIQFFHTYISKGKDKGFPKITMPSQQEWDQLATHNNFSVIKLRHDRAFFDVGSSTFSLQQFISEVQADPYSHADYIQLLQEVNENCSILNGSCLLHSNKSQLL